MLVRADDLERLVPVLRRSGAAVEPEPDAAMLVRGLTAVEIGRLAAAAGVALAELTPRRGSLEDVFMALTQDAVEYGVRA